MTASYQENVSSFNAIINSIKFDAEVCRWFEFLVSQPAVWAQLSSAPQMERAYRDIKEAIFKQRVLLGAAALSVPAAIVLKIFWVVLVTPAIMYFWVRLQKLKARAVVAVSETLISRDYSPKEILANITLYQLSEQYAKKYGIASLVDKIYCFDRVKRYSIFVFLVIVIGIWTVAFSWKAAVVMLCYYELVKALLMTAVVYRRLR